jgi:hypothetical protein
MQPLMYAKESRVGLLQRERPEEDEHEHEESIAQRCGQNTGWKPMLLYPVAWSPRAHGDSSWNGSERSLDRRENKVA